MDNRKDDPWGGDGYLSTILRTVKMHEATDYSSVHNKTEFEPALDFSTSAHKELLIKEQTAALVRHMSFTSTPFGRALIPHRSRLRKTSRP